MRSELPARFRVSTEKLIPVNHPEMSKAKIDKYVNSKPDWAQALLTQIRSAILKGNPHIVEDWKWGGPAFTQNGIVCMLWGFKAHVSITFYHGALLTATTDKFDPCDDENQYNRAIRFAQGDKVPAREIAKLVKLASENNDDGIAPKKKAAKKKVAALSSDFAKELKKNRKAATFFTGLAPSYKTLYTDWISSAKREATKKNRIERALARLKDGHNQPYC